MLFLDVRVYVALWPACTGVIQSLSRTARHVALKSPQDSKNHEHLHEVLLYSLTRKKNNLCFCEKITNITILPSIFWWHALLISVKSLIFSQNLECFKHALDSSIMFIV